MTARWKLGESVPFPSRAMEGQQRDDRPTHRRRTDDVVGGCQPDSLPVWGGSSEMRQYSRTVSITLANSAELGGLVM